MTKKLDNDTIGRIGQNKFEELCKLADLECSRPEPDRTGKDFIVEWPAVPIPGLALDARPSPRVANVQIKSTQTPSTQVKLKLASLDWLVRDDTPGFICSPVLDDNGQVLELRMWHLRGKVLARYLSLLRRAESKNKNTSKTEFSLAISKGVSIPVDGSALKNWMEQEIGDHIGDYRQSKAQERIDVERNGPDGEQDVEVSSQYGDQIDRVEKLFGHRDIELTVKDAHEKRFGIPLPHSKHSKGDVVRGRIVQKQFDSGTLEIGDKDGFTICLDAHVFLSPFSKTIDGNFDIKFECGPLSFIFTENEDGQSGRFMFDHQTWFDSPRDIALTREYLKAHQLFFTGDARLRMTTEKSTEPILRDVTDSIASPTDVEWAESYIRLCDDIIKLWSMAGCDPKQVTISDIDIFKIEPFVLAFTDREIGQLDYQMTHHKPEELGQGIQLGSVVNLLYFTRFEIANEWFAAAATLRATLIEATDKYVFNLLSNQPLDLKRLPIADVENAWDSFRDRTRGLHSYDYELPIE